MPLYLRFAELDVFTTTRFLGNPLAIVHVPHDLNPPLTQEQKQVIAREFNLSETVFLYESQDANNNNNHTTRIDIFTTSQELPFAGHPAIGSGWYLFSNAPAGTQKINLITKAGPIPVIRNTTNESGASKVQLQVPIDFKVHASRAHPAVKPPQALLTDRDYVNGFEGPEPIVSVVKGMTFVLLQVTSEDALTRLLPHPERISVPELGEWGSLLGLYAFFEREDSVLRTRMFVGALEDPATGSAASALGGWLAKQKGEGIWRIQIVQGVEIGRKSEIEVVVEVDGDNHVRRIDLLGSAVKVMDGLIEV